MSVRTQRRPAFEPCRILVFRGKVSGTWTRTREEMGATLKPEQIYRERGNCHGNLARYTSRYRCDVRDCWILELMRRMGTEGKPGHVHNHKREHLWSLSLVQECEYR